MQSLSANKREILYQVAKYLTPTNQRSPRVQDILPQGPQAGEKPKSVRATNYRPQGPPVSQPDERRWLRRLLWFGRTRGASAALQPPRALHNRLCNDGCGRPGPILAPEPT